jgi:hypothetical protein
MRLGRSIDTKSLAALGVEALHLLCSGNIAALADRFGYALAYDREPATAIKDDMRFCLEQLGSSSLELPLDPAPKVQYFKPYCARLKKRMVVTDASFDMGPGFALTFNCVSP